MNSYEIKNLSFSYPEGTQVLKEINLELRQGDFVTLCGPSGCGKSTLLRQLKTVMAPHGAISGEILFEDVPLFSVDQRTQSAKIGFVLQSPENQIVTDKVWHELSFGMESLGYDTAAIRLRVAEMASFFGIQNWFYKSVHELSGGQKQLLNLAAIMAMQPSVLILDEPTSQLDPIAASDFLATVGKINRELGVTILMTEHRLEEVFPMSDRVLVMDHGELICDGTPKEVGLELSKKKHTMFLAMPTPMRIYSAVPNALECPVTVRDGRTWLDEIAQEREVKADGMQKEATLAQEEKEATTVIQLSEVWFRYEKEGPDIVKGLSLKVKKGDFLAILGGNGTGKTTALSLISGLNRPYRGKVEISGTWAALPQNPQSLFVKKTVEEDLLEMLKEGKLSKEMRQKKIRRVVRLCRLESLLKKHPYDLSGGEQQRAALAKVLLLEPEILLLDEATKGLDSEYKRIFAQILSDLRMRGVTIVLVSHDIEFCAEYAQRCAMFFDGEVITEDIPERFFSGNSFYTTSANRMARHRLPGAITVQDVILACGGTPPPEPKFELDSEKDEEEEPLEPKGTSNVGSSAGVPNGGLAKGQPAVGNRKLSKRTSAAMAMILVLIPLTIYVGIYYFGDRKYAFISLLIILETMLPFVMVFEGRKPQARELIVIAVLCGIGVAGRAAFFWVPQFKPVTAIVILAGIALGGETGFLVGAMTGLTSNFFFGQGPWTPWQMFAFGIIGFLAGVLFRKGLLCANKRSMAIFGGISTFFIYGGIMNPASVLMYQSYPTKEMFLLAYLQGIPFDLLHAAATVTFLLLIGEPMLEKLERIKEKYGLIS